MIQKKYERQGLLSVSVYFGASFAIDGIATKYGWWEIWVCWWGEILKKDEFGDWLMDWIDWTHWTN